MKVRAGGEELENGWGGGRAPKSGWSLRAGGQAGQRWGAGSRAGAEGTDIGGRQTGGQTPGQHKKHGVPQSGVPRTDSQQARPGSPPRHGDSLFTGGPHKTPDESTLEGPSASPSQGHPIREGWWVQSLRASLHCSAETPSQPKRPPSAPLTP